MSDGRVPALRRRLRPGDAVTWHHTPRGGYGYVFPIAAEVVKVGAKRIQINAPTVEGDRRLVWVSPDRCVLAGPTTPEER